MKPYAEKIFRENSTNGVMSVKGYEKALKSLKQYESCKFCKNSEPDRFDEFIYCKLHQSPIPADSGCHSFAEDICKIDFPEEENGGE